MSGEAKAIEARSAETRLSQFSGAARFTRARRARNARIRSTLHIHPLRFTAFTAGDKGGSTSG